MRKSQALTAHGSASDVLYGDGPCKVHRIISDDPHNVTEIAAVIAEEYKKRGYISAGKRYPDGHCLPFATHMTEGSAPLTDEDILNFDLIPYLHLIERGLLPSITMDHTVFDGFDPDYPASLSKKCIDIIINKGFDGV